MKITIEFDPGMVTGNLTGPVTSQVEPVSQTTSKAAVQGAPLNAGAFAGEAPAPRASVLPSPPPDPAVIAPESSPPAPHPDNFGLPSGDRQGIGALDAGSYRG